MVDIQPNQGTYTQQLIAGGGWPGVSESEMQSLLSEWQTHKGNLESEHESWTQHQTKLFSGWSGKGADAANGEMTGNLNSLQSLIDRMGRKCQWHQGNIQTVVDTKNDVNKNLDTDNQKLDGLDKKIQQAQKDQQSAQQSMKQHASMGLSGMVMMNKDAEDFSKAQADEKAAEAEKKATLLEGQGKNKLAVTAAAGKIKPFTDSPDGKPGDGKDGKSGDVKQGSISSAGGQKIVGDNSGEQKITSSTEVRHRDVKVASNEKDTPPPGQQQLPQQNQRAVNRVTAKTPEVGTPNAGTGPRVGGIPSGGVSAGGLTTPSGLGPSGLGSGSGQLGQVGQGPGQLGQLSQVGQVAQAPAAAATQPVGQATSVASSTPAAAGPASAAPTGQTAAAGLGSTSQAAPPLAGAPAASGAAPVGPGVGQGPAGTGGGSTGFVPLASAPAPSAQAPLTGGGPIASALSAATTPAGLASGTGGSGGTVVAPVTARVSEREAIEAVMNRGRESSTDPVNQARRFTGAAMVASSDFSYGLRWVSAVCTDGTIMTANSMGVGYVPAEVRIPESIKFVGADSYIPLDVRRSWATYPQRALLEAAELYGKTIRLAVGPQEMMRIDMGVPPVVLGAEDFPPRPVQMSGLTALHIIDATAVADVAGAFNVLELLPPTPTNLVEPPDHSGDLWLSALTMSSGSEHEDRHLTHLAYWRLYCENKRDLAAYAAYTATEPQDADRAVSDYRMWSALLEWVGDARYPSVTEPSGASAPGAQEGKS